MERDSRRIDELFRQRLNPLRVNPPPMAWDRLADAMDQSTEAGFPAKGFSSIGSTSSTSSIYTSWMRKSWTSIAFTGLLLSSLFLAPEHTGYSTAHQAVKSSNLNTYLNSGHDAVSNDLALVEGSLTPSITASQPSALVATVAESVLPSAASVPTQASFFAGTSFTPSLGIAAEQGFTAQPSPSAEPDQPLLAATETLAASLAGQAASLAGQKDASQKDPNKDASKDASNSPSKAASSPSLWSNFYGGLHGSLQWTGLLSQSNAQPDENLNPMLNIGYAFGLHAGYRFNPRVSLETGLVLNSMQGSRYESSVSTRNEEVPVTKSLMLHYTQLPLTVRISPGRATQESIPEGWSYVGGLQYGMLRTSKLRIEDKAVNPERNLQEHDLAVLLGMDYDLPLNDQLFVTLGFRGSLGLNQAHLTTVEGINSDKRNAVLGFRAAFNGFLLPQ